jgi:predicted Zn-dependent protease
VRSLIRLSIALLVILLGLVTYCGNTVENPVTGEQQQVQLSPQQEISLGLQARQQMVTQYGGFYPDKLLQQYIDRVGKQVVARSIASKSPYPFEFYLLRDDRTVNAFALPGGQVFVTIALLKRLTSEAQLAAVLSHEVGHVVARHGAEHLTKQPFSQQLLTAVSTTSNSGFSADPANVLTQAVKQLIGLRYGRDDELESDRLGLRFMTEAGYDPQGIIQLMQRLNASRQSGQPLAFFSTHPSPDNRVKRLQTLITQTYPQGIPRSLKDNRETFAQIVQTRL